MPTNSRRERSDGEPNWEQQAPAAAPPRGSAGFDAPKKRLTINDIARLAGVSKRTVSRVINGIPNVQLNKRERIEELVQLLGFVPHSLARGLALNRSFLVGFVYDNPNSQYIVNLQRGILDVLPGKALGLVVHPIDHSSPSYLTDLRAFVRRQRLASVILPPPLSEIDEIGAALASENCASIRIASVSFQGAGHMVVTHDYLGGRAAARHLVRLGHSTFGCVVGPVCFRSSYERRRGFEAGLAESGLMLEPSCIKTGAYTFESGVACGRALLTMSPRPTAIFAGNDEMACGLYVAAREQGLRIPEDLSVVGYDDAPVARHMTPSLTTIRLPTREMGQAAAHMCVSLQDAEAARQVIEFAPVFVERDSTAPARSRLS